MRPGSPRLRSADPPDEHTRRSHALSDPRRHATLPGLEDALGRGTGRLVFYVGAIGAFVLLARTIAPDRAPPRPGNQRAEQPAFYVSEFDEGIGAAVAILIDTSGSMGDPAPGDGRPKHVVAREALGEVLRATDAFAAKRPEFALKVALYGFASAPWVVHPMQRYDGPALEAALDRIPRPGGGTAIGSSLLEARAALYRAGVFRKYIVVVTDGKNTVGSEPDRVARG